MSTDKRNEKLLADSLHESIFHTTGKPFKNASNIFLFIVIHVCSLTAMVCIFLGVAAYISSMT